MTQNIPESPQSQKLFAKGMGYLCGSCGVLMEHGQSRAWL